MCLAVLYLHTGDVICSCGWVFSFLFYICTQVMSYVHVGGCLAFGFCIHTQVVSYAHVGGCLAFCFVFVHR